MIVLDASAALDLLMRGPAALMIAARVFARGESVHAPHLIDLEITQGLRRLVLAGIMTLERATWPWKPGEACRCAAGGIRPCCTGCGRCAAR